MLCGISTRFQVLSPSYGQVTHALLTRPPLSTSKFNRSLLRKLPARLACVRHAASVRPEPGSNSLVNCYIMHLKRIIYFTSSFQLIFRLTCSSCPTPTDFRRQISKLLFLYNLFRKIPLTKYVETLQEPALFNSQGSVVAPRGNGYLLYHRLFRLSSFF